MTSIRVRLFAFLNSVRTILGATLREIFDENAYARFLQRQELTESQQSYAEFLREHDTTRARRPRCC